MCQVQLPLFKNERRCHGCGSARCLPDGTHQCLHCGRIFKYYRVGFYNCGVSEKRYWDNLNEQLEMTADGCFEHPEEGIVIKP